MRCFRTYMYILKSKQSNETDSRKYTYIPDLKYSPQTIIESEYSRAYVSKHIVTRERISSHKSYSYITLAVMKEKLLDIIYKKVTYSGSNKRIFQN
jgi:hypothetical protein